MSPPTEIKSQNSWLVKTPTSKKKIPLLMKQGDFFVFEKFREVWFHEKWRII
jgi:hypothetical protein